MRRIANIIIAISLLSLLAGCNSDIVLTDQIGMIQHKCVYIEPIKTENPHIGEVLRDVIQKEFMRKRLEICDKNNATVIISGSAFLTNRAHSENSFLSSSSVSSQAVESISLIIRSARGELLGSASYDNNKSLSASKLGSEFGKTLADKLK